MSQLVAFILNEISASPKMWRDHGATVGNGYYHIAINGESYGIGAADYISTSSEKESLLKALVAWRVECVESESPLLKGGKAETATDFYIRTSYEKFSKRIRAAIKSFPEEGDWRMLSEEIKAAIADLDGILQPMESIERRDGDAKQD